MSNLTECYKEYNLISEKLIRAISQEVMRMNKCINVINPIDSITVYEIDTSSHDVDLSELSDEEFIKLSKRSMTLKEFEHSINTTYYTGTVIRFIINSQ